MYQCIHNDTYITYQLCRMHNIFINTNINTRIPNSYLSVTTVSGFFSCRQQAKLVPTKKNTNNTQRNARLKCHRTKKKTRYFFAALLTHLELHFFLRYPALPTRTAKSRSTAYAHSIVPIGT